MTIVRKNLSETRWLLNFYKGHKGSVPNGLEKLLLGNAVGKFFARSSEFYCGSYPLHFAACSNNTRIFDTILAYASALGTNVTIGVELSINNHTPGGRDTSQHTRLGSNVIFMRDQHGNNCLHLVVNHNLKDMYTHIKQTAYNLIQKEIRLAYADKLLSLDEEDDDPYIYLSSLPVHLEGFRCGYCPVESEIVSPVDRLSAEAFNVWLCAVTEKKLEERMELVLNEDFHSPLTLCAASKKGDKLAEEKKRDMISFLISQLKKERWTYGPVKCSLLPLEGVEYAYYEARYQSELRPLPEGARSRMHGVLEWIAITESSTVAKLPVLQKIVTTKWHRFGYPIFVQQFCYRLVLTILVTLLLCFVNATPNYTTSMSKLLGIELAVTILYPIALFMIVLIICYEMPCLVRYGYEYFGLFSSRSIRGAAKYEKMCNTIMILAFTSLITNEYIRHIKYELRIPIDVVTDLGVKLSFTICIGFIWLYLFYFFMGFDRTGPFVLTIYRIVSRDIPFFITFYFIVVIAFGCALSLLTSSGNSSMSYGFTHVILTIFDLIQITVNMQQKG